MITIVLDYRSKVSVLKWLLRSSVLYRLKISKDGNKNPNIKYKREYKSLHLKAPMNNVQTIRSLLKHVTRKNESPLFYKTGPGQYAEHDRFLGITVPDLRKIAKQFKELSHTDLKTFIRSPLNEERLLALFILTHQYQINNDSQRAACYQFYMKHLKHVNNWNLVDASAHLILGAHVFQGDKNILLTLAKSDNLWERRIAIVSTWYFIRNNELSWTFKIAKLLLQDHQDLIHKAVGWMLREAGKRSVNHLIAFLDQYAEQMPRTMLRYAIEKFQETQRKQYLLKKTLKTE